MSAARCRNTECRDLFEEIAASKPEQMLPGKNELCPKCVSEALVRREEVKIVPGTARRSKYKDGRQGRLISNQNYAPRIFRARGDSGRALG